MTGRRVIGELGPRGGVSRNDDKEKLGAADGLKSRVLKALPVVLALAIIAGLCWVAHLLGRGLLVWFGSLQKDVAAALLTAFAAVIVSVASLVLSKYFERKAVIRKEHRDKKVPIYEKSIEFWFKLLMAEKAGRKPPSEQEVIQFLQDFTQELIVWGSDSVLKAFATFREALISYRGTAPPIQGILLFEKYMLEIRKDLGHKNTNLGSGDILALFINDIRERVRSDTGDQHDLPTDTEDVAPEN